MGQLIDETHPIFEEFPTEFHNNWQWWPMAQLLECKCGKGKILFSSGSGDDRGGNPWFGSVIKEKEIYGMRHVGMWRFGMRAPISGKLTEEIDKHWQP